MITKPASLMDFRFRCQKNWFPLDHSSAEQPRIDDRGSWETMSPGVGQSVPMRNLARARPSVVTRTSARSHVCRRPFENGTTVPTGQHGSDPGFPMMWRGAGYVDFVGGGLHPCKEGSTFGGPRKSDRACMDDESRFLKKMLESAGCNGTRSSG